MSLYIQVPIQQIADGLTAIGWSSAGGGGDATLSYGSTVPETPVNGTLWYDTTATLLKLYTGGTWTTINVSAETIATISGYATTAQSAASTATQKLTEFKAIQVTATTLSAESSATASFNSGTGVITLGIPTGATGLKGVDGEVSTAQLNTAISGITKISLGLSNVDNTSDANKPISTAIQTAFNNKANLSANTYTAPQRTNTSASSNAIDFRIANNFTINATAANITVTSLLGCIGQGGVIVIESAENVTGWGAEFNFKTVPASLSGMEVFSYFVQTETVIRIGRVS